MKQLILYFLVIATFASCNLIPFPHSENIDYTYSEDKLPDFRRNDTIYYKDTVNNQEEIYNLSVFSYHNIIDNVSYDQAKFHYYPLTHLLKYRDIVIYFSNINYNKTIFYKIDDDKEISEFETKSTCANYLLNGQSYTSVDILSRNDSTYADIVPKTIYVSCKYGILRYEYLDGRVYELENK